MIALIVLCVVTALIFWVAFNMTMTEIALYWQERAEQSAALGAPIAIVRSHQQRMRDARKWAPLARLSPHYRQRLYGEIKR